MRQDEQFDEIREVTMPRLGESVEEATINKWLKREGEHVRQDEPLVEVVTDKVNAEVPAPATGRLIKISAAEGEVVNVGAVVARIAVLGGTSRPIPATATGDASHLVMTATSAPSTSPPDASFEPISAPARQRMSPAARKLAADNGIDPAKVQGSGLGGRITRDDVATVVDRSVSNLSPPPRSEPGPDSGQTKGPRREELLAISAMRRSIAEHMVRSVSTAPHAWAMHEVDMTNLVRHREAMKEGFKQRHGVSVTYLPFVAQILCRALKKFPSLNSSWTPDGIVLKLYVNLGIAVSIPDGLIVPVLKDADQLGFSDLVKRLDDLVVRARSRALKPADVQDGTFTLNNTGATGSVASQPIINQPQAAILTTEAIVKRVVVVNDAIAVRHVMNLCISIDHRILDGMVTGQFLSFIKRELEGWTADSVDL
jgi:2-oxoisovalerate dehydrogenase E2 component (dihydrolipoyl transacylase)